MTDTADDGGSRHADPPGAAAQAANERRAFELFRGVVYPAYCDDMGHLNTQFYMFMFDQAARHLLASLQTTPADTPDGRGWADVRHVLEYKREVRSGALIRIEGQWIAVGRRSVDYRLTMLELGSAAAVATMDARTVRFDLNRRTAVPLEDGIRLAAERWVGSPSSREGPP